MSALSNRQIKVLRWIDERPHHISRWLVGTREPITEGPELWTHLELSGRSGRIRIAKADLAAIRELIEVSRANGKIYRPNKAGADFLKSLLPTLVEKESE